MQSNPLQNEVSRILKSQTPKELVTQLKNIGSYETRIEQQLMNKTNQIVQLQNYMREEIANIQLIAEENGKLKKDIEKMQRQLTGKQEENDYLQGQVMRLSQMNKESNNIIKRLEDRTIELEEEIIGRTTHNILMDCCGVQTDQNHQQNKHIESPLSAATAAPPSTAPISAVPVTTAVVPVVPDRTNGFSSASLLNKISELQEMVMKLKYQKNQLTNKINKIQQNNSSVSSIWQSQSDQCSIKQPLQLQTIIDLIIQDNLRQLKFKGEVVEGNKEGKGICEYQDNILYQGQFHHGKRQGLGTLLLHDQLIYRGFWKNGVMEGKGILKMIEGEIQHYEGQFKGGKLDGYGCMKLKSGKKITAGWKNGKIVSNCLEVVDNTKRYRQPQLIECY